MTHSLGSVGSSNGVTAAATHHGGSFIANHSGMSKHHGNWNHHHHHGHGGQFVGAGYGFGGGFLSSLLYGLGAYGYGGYSTHYGNYDPLQFASLVPQAPEGSAADPTLSAATSASLARANAFANRGEIAFSAGNYEAAVYDWRHAVIDDPQNPLVLMLLGQALFATGHYDEAAGATQAAMHLMPKDNWGVVVKNYRELYGNTRDYTTQIRALEAALRKEPNDPAMRFLAGFHYAHLGYPAEAVYQLDKGLLNSPNDEVAKLLRDEMQLKLPKPADATTVPEATPTNPAAQ
jgi:tetratricopeptide (TPR) repeat protein